jgi:hypothetical protein
LVQQIGATIEKSETPGGGTTVTVITPFTAEAEIPRKPR